MEYLTCPLCGRTQEGKNWDSEIPNNQEQIESQVEHLDIVLSRLLPGDTSLMENIPDKAKLCPMCKKLTENIRSEEDRKLFETRINEQVERLEERYEDLEPGQI